MREAVPQRDRGDRAGLLRRAQQAVARALQSQQPQIFHRCRVLAAPETDLQRALRHAAMVGEFAHRDRTIEIAPQILDGPAHIGRQRRLEAPRQRGAVAGELVEQQRRHHHMLDAGVDGRVGGAGPARAHFRAQIADQRLPALGHTIQRIGPIQRIAAGQPWRKRDRRRRLEAEVLAERVFDRAPAQHHAEALASRIQQQPRAQCRRGNQRAAERELLQLAIGERLAMASHRGLNHVLVLAGPRLDLHRGAVADIDQRQLPDMALLHLDMQRRRGVERPHARGPEQPRAQRLHMRQFAGMESMDGAEGRR